MFLTLIYYEQLLFSQRPDKPLYKERSYILLTLQATYWILYQHFSHTLGFIFLFFDSLFKNIPFSPTCRFVLLKLGTSLIHISLCFNCNNRLIGVLLSLYPPRALLLTSFIQPVKIVELSPIRLVFWLSATRPLYLITFHNKPLLSFSLHFVGPDINVAINIYSIHCKFALTTNKNKIISTLYCITVFHMVHLSIYFKEHYLVGWLGFEPRTAEI